MDNQPFLYDLYHSLQLGDNRDKPGLEEYYLFLDFLKSGQYEISNFNELAFVLETLWLKSSQHRQQFQSLLRDRKMELIELIAFIRQDLNHDDQKKPGGSEDPGKKVNETGKDVNSALQGNTPLPDPLTPDAAGQGTNQQRLKPNEESIPEGDYGFGISEKSAGNYKSLRLQKLTEETTLLQHTPFLFSNDYFPVRSRELQQAWRGLKSKREGNSSTEISFIKTIEAIAEKGHIFNFEYEKLPQNQLKLFIFLDQSESMVAVNDFGLELCKTAVDSDLHKDLQPWFFNGTPPADENGQDYYFYNHDLTERISLRKLFFNLNPKDISVLIYSDAGSLSGQYDNERIGRTLKFLKLLTKSCAFLAWLNPAPVERWPFTNAEEIRKSIPMHSTDRGSIESALSVLKGKHS